MLDATYIVVRVESSREKFSKMGQKNLAKMRGKWDEGNFFRFNREHC